MKKLKIVLSSVLVFILSAFLLTACGNAQEPSYNDYSTTTISLEEARNTIVNALAFDNPQNLDEIGNLNAMEKFGKYMLVYNEKICLYDESGDFVRDYTRYWGENVEYNDGKYVKGLIREEGRETYLDNLADIAWQYDLSDRTVAERSDRLLNSPVKETVTRLFIADRFDEYDKSVEKESFGNSYTLTLTSTSTYSTSMYDLPDEIRAKICPQSVFKVMVGFKNNELVSIKCFSKFGVAIYGSNGELNGYESHDGTMELYKINGEITEPEWLLDYLASQQN